MDAGDSAQGVAAVEVAHERAARPAPTFFHGAFAGVAIAAVLAQVWLVIQLAPLRGTYKDLGAAALPFALQTWWLYGVPAAGIAMVAGLVVARPRQAVVYAVAAVVLVGLAIATWHFAYAPLWALTPNLSE